MRALLQTSLCCVALLLAGSGCANLVVGQPLPMGNVQCLREGFTTKDEVRKLFGQPLHNVPGSGGEVWVYRYLDGKGVAQELVVSFNGPYVCTFKAY